MNKIIQFFGGRDGILNVPDVIPVICVIICVGIMVKYVFMDKEFDQATYITCATIAFGGAGASRLLNGNGKKL